MLFERGKREVFERYFGNKYFTFELDDWVFTEQAAGQKLLKHFGVRTLKGFGVDHLHSGIVASGAVLEYLEMTQHTHIGHVTSLARIDEERYVRLDRFTIRSLELLRPMQDDGASLLDVIDKTVTPMGARLLKRWMVFPLRDAKAISNRLDVVDSFFRDTELRDVVDEQFHRVGDLERIISKVAAGRVSPREVVQLRTALQALCPVKAACLASGNDELRRIGDNISLCENLVDRIGREVREDSPQLVSKGGVIKDGVNAELDELRRISTGGKEYLLKIQERETEATGIASLKVGYNNVFGYYLEVRNIYKDKVPQDWVRKQTLAQAERYITQELKEYEEKILGAEEKMLAIEQRIYAGLVEFLSRSIAAFQRDAAVVARADCLRSFAVMAAERGYCRPELSEDKVIDIRDGRHPVIETLMDVGQQYIPNDVYLDDTSQQIMMITGPNMAGKSALLRQTALIVLMAQMGSFVPASSAHIGVVDKIFTRVGASDNISQGESTFMVEMLESASIMNNLSDRSLILLDEIGRGTSTYDGMSIAWAMVEYIHNHPAARAKTMFATHYHELNELEELLPRVKNYNVSVKEVNRTILFLRKLVRGGTEHSFGIHVAKMAGMPVKVIERAEAILASLEGAGRAAAGPGEETGSDVREEAAVPAGVRAVAKPSGRGKGRKTSGAEEHLPGVQLSMFQLEDPVLVQIRDQIRGLDIDSLTPIQALNMLNDIKRITGL